MKSALTIVPLLFGICFAGPAAPAAKPAAHDTLVNGSFNQPVANGWRQEANDYVGIHAISLLKDGGVQVKKEMCGRAAIVQDVKLPRLDVNFSTRAQFSAQATTTGYYAYSALVLGFLDQDGKNLGETRVYASAGTLPWKGSGTLHLIPVKDAATWADTKLNLADELKTNLKGVGAARVKALRITFESFGSGTDAC